MRGTGRDGIGLRIVQAPTGTEEWIESHLATRNLGSIHRGEFFFLRPAFIADGGRWWRVGSM